MFDAAPRFSHWRRACLQAWGEPLPDQIQPDCQIAGTTADDWQTVFDLVRASNWKWRYHDPTNADTALPDARDALTASDGTWPHLFVWLTPDLAIVFYLLYGPETVGLDFDLDAIKDQATLSSLCEAVRRIARELRKDETMSYGSATSDVLCRYIHMDDRFELSTP